MVDKNKFYDYFSLTCDTNKMRKLIGNTCYCEEG